MAVSQVPAALIPKIWSKALWLEQARASYFEKFIGNDENSIIQRNTDLEKEAGDTVTFGLLMQLTGDGVDGDSTLEGNEESMVFYDQSVTINQKRQAIRLAGLLAEQKSPYDMRNRAKGLLKNWFARYRDKKFFTVLSATPSANRILRAGGKAAENLIADTDKLTLDLIALAKRKAELATPMLRPVMVDGEPHFVAVFHPWQIRDLKGDPDYKAAVLNAAERGKKNPMFTGAIAMWDGVIIHEHAWVPVTATGASGANVGQGLFLGAQAAVEAVAKKLYWREKAFDYANQQGFAGGIIHGVAKSKYASEDFGCFVLQTAAKAE